MGVNRTPFSVWQIRELRGGKMDGTGSCVCKGWASETEKLCASPAMQRCAKPWCGKKQLPSWLLMWCLTIKCHEVKHAAKIAVREAKLELGVSGSHSSSLRRFRLRLFLSFEQRLRPSSLPLFEGRWCSEQASRSLGLKRHHRYSWPVFSNVHYNMAEQHLMFLGIMGNRFWVAVRAIYTFHQKSKTCKQTEIVREMWETCKLTANAGRGSPEQMHWCFSQPWRSLIHWFKKHMVH